MSALALVAKRAGGAHAKASCEANFLRPSPPHAMRRRVGGSKLPDATRKDFESRFGHDFSQVRVHGDDGAVHHMGARAFTEGNDIVFATGQYNPHTKRGRELLAHELAHVVQQPGVISPKEDSPFDELESRRFRERALRYEPRLRPHVPTAPRIPEPPVPAENAPPVLPRQCPPRDQIRAELASAGAVDATIGAMQRQINISREQTETRGVAFRPNLLRRAETAIRAAFGRLIPSGPRLTDPGSTTVLPPAAFAHERVPTQADAERRVGDAVIEVAVEGEEEMERRLQASERGTPSTSPAPTVTSSLLRSLCIRDGRDTNLLAFVIQPLIRRQGLQFVRDWEAARIGGQTTFPPTGPRRVDIPTRIRNLGHIIVHEAMHFYVHDRYRMTAEADPRREDVLMEGGAEYLARHVIHARLANAPEFAINYTSRADQFRFVSTYIARGGVDTFALAYLRGQVELIGLGARPKLAVTSPGDPVEREADRMAAAALSDARR